MQRHDREQLVDRPAVRQRLEHREVAEVDVGQDRLEVLELLRDLAELARQVAHLRAGRPVQPLGEAPHLDRQVAEAEHLQRLFARLLRVVPALDQAPLADRLPGVVEVRDRRRQAAVAGSLGHAEAVEARGAERVEHQHAVVRGDRAARLADDHRVGQAARIADAGDAVDDVVRVLAQRIVGRRLEIGARAVVVDAEPAADVDVFEPGAEAGELRVDLGELVDRVLDPADVVQLRARVAVHQLQAVEHAVRAQHLDQLQDLGGEQAELGAIARRLAPAARTLGGELHAHADPRPHLVLLGVLQDVAQLREVLDHRDDRASELGREDHRLDVVVVLEAVADDEPARRVAGHRHHREQLRLAAGLEPEAEVRAAAVHLLDDQALLVDLDREHRRVAVLVVVLGDRRGERVVQRAQPVAQDVREAQHHRRRQVARLELAHHLVQVDLAFLVAVGAADDVPGGVDAEVAGAPGADRVELLGVLDAPVRPRGHRSACQAVQIGVPFDARGRGRYQIRSRAQPVAPDRGSTRSTSLRRDGRPRCRPPPAQAGPGRP